MTQEQVTGLHVDFYKKFARIQQNLKSPKGNTNKFGGYKYRTCSDILEAVKPLLDGLYLVVSDEIVNIGNRFYVKATACLGNAIVTQTVTAYAREAETKKGMDESQITGAASSYARKYALNGLFAIDDTKDADVEGHIPEGFNHFHTPSYSEDDYSKPIGTKAEVSQPHVSQTPVSGTQRIQILKTVPMKSVKDSVKDTVKKSYYQGNDYEYED